MPEKILPIDHLTGLTQSEAERLQIHTGKNLLRSEPSWRCWHIVLNIVREPMFLLLAIACSLYFILGETSEGLMTMGAILLVTAISLFQDIRSAQALDALKIYARQQVAVLRNGVEVLIDPVDLVPGDLMSLEEGNTIPADGKVIQENDFTTDESLITGESMPVNKIAAPGEDFIFQGAMVNSGKCYAVVTAIGNNTVLGKLGKSVAGQPVTKTFLQQQVGRHVKRLAIFGISAFVLIWLVNYLRSGMMLESFLFGLTLAMAALPEEIPVAFSSFMALGAYQMSRLGIISRHPQVIENLGTVSVICLDKTGTITENKMKVKEVLGIENNALISVESGDTYTKVLGYARLASEQSPFDPMEKALHIAYEPIAVRFKFNALPQVYEYPLEGKPPMMTHVFNLNDKLIVAGKGATERIMRVCHLSPDITEHLTRQVKAQASKGYRIIGIASAVCTEGQLPSNQDDFNWNLEGFICLYDPPKQSAKVAIARLEEAKIAVKLLTGDYPETAVNIAEQVGIPFNQRFITGEQVMSMSDNELSDAVKNTNIFARMFPDAKERVVKYLQANGELVAMTGDGVNDAPALKAADIGIAMGEKGAELARGVSDLVITDDNLEKMVEAVKQGRKIFINLKKSIRYIISIHIPIILTAALPILLGWQFPNIFSPIHIIFLELIMGPTCSIFFEREPVEDAAMKMSPRRRNTNVFTGRELIISITQGMIIALGVLSLYYLLMISGTSIKEVRTAVFTTLLLANLLLTFTNRSFRESFLTTIHYKNSLAIWVFLISVVYIVVIHIFSPIRNIFGLEQLSLKEWLLCMVIAFISVMWFDLYKTILRRNKRFF